MIMIEARVQLIKTLLEYGSDPNRGLVLVNKKKLTIDKNFFLRDYYYVSRQKKQHIDMYPNYTDSDSSDSILPTDLTNISCDPGATQSLETLTPIDSPLLLLCCLYNYDNLQSLSKGISRFDSKASHIPSSHHIKKLKNEENYE